MRLVTDSTIHTAQSNITWMIVLPATHFHIFIHSKQRRPTSWFESSSCLKWLYGSCLHIHVIRIDHTLRAIVHESQVSTLLCRYTFGLIIVETTHEEVKFVIRRTRNIARQLILRRVTTIHEAWVISRT